MNPIDTQSLSQSEVAGSVTGSIAPDIQVSDDDLAILQASLTGTAKERERDVLGWYRAVPQLLADGEEGRFALIHGGQVVSTWDTYGDAMQAGYEKFGPEQSFWTGEIKQRALEQVRKYLADQRAKQCPS